MPVLERTLAGEQIARYDRDGFLVVPGVFAPDEIAEIRDTFMEQAKNGPVPGLSEIKRRQTGYDPSDPLHFYPRMMQPHRHPEYAVGPLARRYLLDARIASVLRDLLRDEPVAAQTMFYFKPPGARGQALHQDNFYLRVKPGNCIAAWIAVDDADRENGGMVVVPGSGDLDIACPEPADKTQFFTDHHVPLPAHLREQPVDLKAGDILFFNGSVIHGSYPNTSPTRFRRSLICHYAPESCAEVSFWYRPLLRFDGNELYVDEATGGGPCGMETVKGPH